MNRLNLLKTRRSDLLKSGEDIRKFISSLLDEQSFVETNSYSFSKDEFYGVEAQGEGVVTGFGTIADFPFYVICQNFNVLNGGLSKGQCDKMLKCMNQAEKNSTPIIYVLNSFGMQIGEGIKGLEGLTEVLRKVSELKGLLPQFCVINGECYGSGALISGLCDFTFMFENSVLATNSPLVISAKSGKLLTNKEVAGQKIHKEMTGICSFAIKDVDDLKSKLTRILGLLPEFSEIYEDNDDLNTPIASLDKNCNASLLIKKVFDTNTFIEIGEGYAKEVICGLGRIGGIIAGTITFDGDKDGVALNEKNIRKIKDFIDFTAMREIPLINFVNTVGILPNLEVEQGNIIKSVADLIESMTLSESRKISIIYGKAIGLGYSLFASKAMGYDFTYAFLNSTVALLDGEQGVEVEFSETLQTSNQIDRAKIIDKYNETNSDPFNSAKDGFIDDIIEPAFVRQYLIASLQMIIR